jgi:hypothetical protein
MAYAMQYVAPGNPAMYERVKELIGDVRPEGLIVNLVIGVEQGLLHLGVWNSESDCARFRDEHVRPAVQQMLREHGLDGPVPEPVIQELDLVDVQLGAIDAAAEIKA